MSDELERTIDALLRPEELLEDYDEHAGGQLRLGAAGDQTELLPIPDDEIPTIERSPDDEPPTH